MIVTLWQSELALYRADCLCLAWHEARFDPRPFAAEMMPHGFRRLRLASRAVEVECPVGSRIVAWRGAERARLACYFDRVGLDAESVLWLSRRGLRGFGMAGAKEEVGA